MEVCLPFDVSPKRLPAMIHFVLHDESQLHAQCSAAKSFWEPPESDSGLHWAHSSLYWPLQVAECLAEATGSNFQRTEATSGLLPSHFHNF